MAFSAPPRPLAPGRKPSSMRPPPPPRPGVNRAQTATPTLNGRATPIDGRQRSPKRKAPMDVLEVSNVEETNINVVVRCRGRNDREVRENSAVVVSSDGIKGKKVELSMGPNALSNKAYQFDKVFSPAADQGMIFDEVVTPILDEVLAGFNCTIFAYGQTGTGKTYTMSGDITDMLPIPEAAGIIPRVLHALFDKLNADDANKMDTIVKCSFIELYNEELRDLLAADEGTKLKIFDDANKNGRTTTLVQGMEETHIENASKGIQLLCAGSHKRQVAATKCNDLSSRSHTIFTMTIYTKQPSQNGEDYIASSKLNLVDLAGSENIQRSGAENKRATEAGLINKSLLTLGRVINALVDRSSHIPYRESKLTRLLQDSLGGRTKTCIIATLSPAKSNLEETISTLDYAFRAKNIRNKPQLNQLVSKKTLLREFTSEIEKLKSELIATRHRNGYYLTAEAYEELTTQSESRRILSEEQRDKIETMESNLRNKVQELFNLTNNFQSMKKDNDQIKGRLESTRDLLDNTEMVLGHAKQSLAEETHLRKAYAETELMLSSAAQEMRKTLETTTEHIEHLHDKLERITDVQDGNRARWTNTEGHVAGHITSLETQLELLQRQQSEMFAALTGRVDTFVKDELTAMQSSKRLIQSHATSFSNAQQDLDAQDALTRSELGQVLGEVCTLRDNVKAKVGSGLDDLAVTAQRISAGIAREVGDLHGHLRESQALLSRELTSVFDNITTRMSVQQAEIIRLRQQNIEAQNALIAMNEEAQFQLQRRLEDDREVAQTEHAELMSKIGSLVQDASFKHEKRLASHVEYANKRIKTSESDFKMSMHSYGQGMDAWIVNADALTSIVAQSKQTAQDRVSAAWNHADERLLEIGKTTDTVHVETINAIDNQMSHMDTQLLSLDDIVARVKAQSEDQHSIHASTIARIANTVHQSYRGIQDRYEQSSERARAFESSISKQTDAYTNMLEALQSEGQLQKILEDIREDINAGRPAEYERVGSTPARHQYTCPDVLPYTKPRDLIIDAMRGQEGRVASPTKSPSKRSPKKRSPTKIPSSPSKTHVFSDGPRSISKPPVLVSVSTADTPQSPTQTTTLREIDVNIKSTALVEDTKQSLLEDLSRTTPAVTSARQLSQKNENHKPQSKRSAKMVSSIAEGRENANHLIDIGGSIGSGSGRTLRSRGS
ncbi:hypothetical protein AMS68_002355 [Peltaster fructicola]|uniref:Kinesin motor domain-containing protein n=1 Tax=Peltaster fructicola TaxID=286661 RepID=A0A6H0XQC3_9PEZI|nr:hypothetical protein AMS68_002355 [Peltaster fructicola]